MKPVAVVRIYVTSPDGGPYEPNICTAQCPVYQWSEMDDTIDRAAQMLKDIPLNGEKYTKHKFWREHYADRVREGV